MIGLPQLKSMNSRRCRLLTVRKVAVGIVLLMGSYIPIRMAIANYQSPIPEAVITLGGDRSREYITAGLSRSNPDLDVWISSGSLPEQSEQIFQRMGAETSRVNLDYKATDTVSNFTTILPHLQAANIRHVYLVTSDYHMDRAEAIATIVLGSHGITYTALSVPSSKPSESLGHIIRDVARSMVWLATGKTGSRLKQPQCYGLNELEAIAELLKPQEQRCHQRITQQ